MNAITKHQLLYDLSDNSQRDKYFSGPLQFCIALPGQIVKLVFPVKHTVLALPKSVIRHEVNCRLFYDLPYRNGYRPKLVIRVIDPGNQWDPYDKRYPIPSDHLQITDNLLVGLFGPFVMTRRIGEFQIE